MFTTEQYFKGAAVSTDIARNAEILLLKVNTFLEQWGGEKRMVSGYRSPAYNKTIKNAAPNSKHMAGLAIDVADYDKSLAVLCIEKEHLLAEYGLWCEDMRATKNWVHFQSVPPVSGKRFYIPNLEWAKKLTGPLTKESLHVLG